MKHASLYWCARRGRGLLAASVLFLAGLAALAGAAEPGLVCHRLLHPPQDSAVELELDMSPQVMSLLTTDSGKAGGVFDGVDWPKGVDESYKDLDWDPLDYDTKLKLLRAASKARHQQFFSDRKIHGVHVKGEVQLNFDARTKFLGKSFDRGGAAVDVSKVLGLVEYRGPTEVEGVSGVELHFRGRQSSGTMSNDAWTFLDAAGIPRDHQHIHMVATLPTARLTADPALQAARMGDFFRRANLIAEMNDIMDGGSIINNETATAVYFASLKPEMLSGVTSYFYDVGHGQNRAIGDSYKMGWVGMRGSDKYDAPGLWGIEYRAVSAGDDPARVRTILDGLQWDMTNDEYGIEPEALRKWLEPRLGADPTRDPSDALYYTWYNRSWTDLVHRAPPAVKKVMGFTGILRTFRAAQIRWLYGKGAEVKLLLYDWPSDPLLIGKPELAAKIEQAQAAALKRVLMGHRSVKVVQDFLRSSGLYELTAHSLGLDELVNKP